MSAFSKIHEFMGTPTFAVAVCLRRSIRPLAALCLAMISALGCASSECAAGEGSVCRGTSCRCGAECTSNSQCEAGDICAEYALAPGTGACVDETWAGTGGIGDGMCSNPTSSGGSCGAGTVDCGVGCCPAATPFLGAANTCYATASAASASGPCVACRASNMGVDAGGPTGCHSRTACVSFTSTIRHGLTCGDWGEADADIQNNCLESVKCRFCYEGDTCGNFAGDIFTMDPGGHIGSGINGVYVCYDTEPPVPGAASYGCVAIGDSDECLPNF